MASRPVFLPVDHAPFVRSLQVEFTWNAGLSVSQKQKNVAALHAAYLRRNVLIRAEKYLRSAALIPTYTSLLHELQKKILV